MFTMTPTVTVPIAGVDTQEFAPERRDGFDGEVRVGTVGRLINDKGYPDLFDCATKLGSQFQFYVAGDGPAYETLAARKPANVELLGSLKNDKIPEFMNSIDIYFQPSISEGLCITVIEAMACGLPVVASSVGGICDSVEHGETGYLAQPRETAEFTRRLQQLANDKELRSQFGCAGRERVKKRYSRQILVTEFTDAVTKLSNTAVANK